MTLETFKSKLHDDMKMNIDEFLGGIPLWKWFPGEMYLSGGGFNLIIDPTLKISDEKFANCDIDLFILGTEERKREILKDFMQDLQNKCGKGTAIYVGVNRSVLNIWITGYSRMVQLILMNDQTHKNVNDILEGFDFDHLRAAYDGNDIVVTKDAYDAICTRVTRYNGQDEKNKVTNRMMKALMRDYKFSPEEHGVKMSEIFAEHHAAQSILFKFSELEEYLDSDVVCKTLKDKYNCLHVIRYSHAEKFVSVDFEGINHTNYHNYDDNSLHIYLGERQPPKSLQEEFLMKRVRIKTSKNHKYSYLTGIVFVIKSLTINIDMNNDRYGDLSTSISAAEFKFLREVEKVVKVAPYFMTGNTDNRNLDEAQLQDDHDRITMNIAPRLPVDKLEKIIKKPFLFLTLNLSSFNFWLHH